MTLFVDPQAVSGFAGQVDRAAGQVSEMRRYLNTYAEAGTGGEVYNLARSSHEHAVSVMDAAINRLACLLENSAPELLAAASYYRTTDLAAADAIERTLPPAPDRCITPLELELASNPCDPVNFADRREVTEQLKPPEEAENPANALGWMDYLSPSAWANSAFDTVFGFDPIGELQARLVGDWEALAAMSPVTRNLGSALHDLAYNVQSGTTTLRPMWQGTAGESAFRYFTTTCNGVADLHDPFNNVSQAYTELADGVWAIGEAIGGIVKSMLDSAIIAGISIAAGTATSASGVGAVIGYGLAAGEVATCSAYGDTQPTSASSSPRS